MSDIPLRRTRAIVDLDAIEHNVRVIQRRVPDAGIVAVMKADGYGHGSIPVAAACARAGAAMVAVANLEEGAILAGAGVTLPVMMLGELFPGEIESALRRGFHLTVGSVANAAAIGAVAERLGRRAKLHVNVETGMNRLGLGGSDIVGALSEIAGIDSVEIVGIFTHFPAADERDSSFSYEQISRFTTILRSAAAKGIEPEYTHVTNSGGVISFPGQLVGNLVRPGIAVYGLFPSREIDHDLDLRPAMTLASSIVKITYHEGPAEVGYGRTYRVEAGSVIGIVPIGYADGYPRLLSNNADVLVHGVRVPVVGRVSMDMIALDLTALPEPAAVTDEVVIIGTQRYVAADGISRAATVTAEELGERSQSFAYEIVCNLNERIPRVYLREGNVVATKTMSAGLLTVEPAGTGVP